MIDDKNCAEKAFSGVGCYADFQEIFNKVRLGFIQMLRTLLKSRECNACVSIESLPKLRNAMVAFILYIFCFV